MLLLLALASSLFFTFFFFFNDTATTEIYTLSLHDALPISRGGRQLRLLRRAGSARPRGHAPRVSGSERAVASVHGDDLRPVRRRLSGDLRQRDPPGRPPHAPPDGRRDGGPAAHERGDLGDGGPARGGAGCRSLGALVRALHGAGLLCR